MGDAAGGQSASTASHDALQAKQHEANKGAGEDAHNTRKVLLKCPGAPAGPQTSLRSSLPQRPALQGELLLPMRDQGSFPQSITSMGSSSPALVQLAPPPLLHHHRLHPGLHHHLHQPQPGTQCRGTSRGRLQHEMGHSDLPHLSLRLVHSPSFSNDRCCVHACMQISCLNMCRRVVAGRYDLLVAE